MPRPSRAIGVRIAEKAAWDGTGTSAPHLGLPRAEAMAGAVLEGALERPLSDMLGG